MGLFIHLVKGAPGAWEGVDGPTLSCSYGTWCDLQEMVEENVCGLRNMISIDSDEICFNSRQIEREYEELKDIEISQDTFADRCVSEPEREFYKDLYDTYVNILETAVNNGYFVRFA